MPDHPDRDRVDRSPAAESAAENCEGTPPATGALPRSAPGRTEQKKLLGNAVHDRAFDVAAVVVATWQTRGTTTPSTHPDATAVIARDCRLGTDLIGRYLATGDGPTEHEITLLDHSGAQAAAHRFPWADITRNLLTWRSTTARMIAEEGARLGIDHTVVAEAIALVRSRADAGLIHLAERFDTERESLHRQLSAEQAKMTYLALHDPLTGLPNRTQLLDRLTRVLTEPRPHPVTVLFLDLDGFKTINDRFGHSAGDAVLAAVSDALSELIAPPTILARYGGDEFVIVSHHTDHGTDAFLTRISATVAECGVPDADLELAVSIGLATARNSETPEQVLTRADLAMYATKHHRPPHPAHQHRASGTGHRSNTRQYLRRVD